MRIFRDRLTTSPSERGRTGGITLLVLLACLSLVGLETWTAWQSRDEQVTETRDKTDNLARAAAEHTVRSIEAVDLVLRGMAERLDHDGIPAQGDGRLRQLLVDRAGTLPQVQFFSVIDDSGMWRVTSSARLSPLSLADRPYFRFHRDHPEAGMQIGGLVKSRLDGRWVITASRGFKRADGQFGGIVLAVLDLEYFRRFYQTLSIGRGGIIALFDDGGTMLTRHPFVEEAIGHALTKTLIYGSETAGVESASFSHKSTVDGVYRQYRSRRLPNLPLTIVAALARDEELAGWRRTTIEHFLGGSMVCLILIGLAVRIDRQIRRHKQADREAIHANAEYRLLADSATDMIFRLDLDFVRRYVSPASRDILGYEPEELVDTKPVDMIHPEDAERVAATYRALADGQEHGSVTNRIRHRDGRWIWVEVTLRLIRDADGQPSGIMGALRDISVRKAAELEAANANARLTEANHLLRRTETIGHIGHWRFDLLTNDLLWSEEIYRIYGLPLTYRPTVETAIDAYHPDDRELVATAFNRATTEGTAFEIDVRLVQPDGSVRNVISTGQCDHDSAGRLIAITGAFQDVTDRKLADWELRLSQERLALVLQAANLATWRLDLAAGTREVSDHYLTLADFSREEFPKSITALWDHIHPEDGPVAKQAFADHVAARSPLFEVEMRFRQKDGGWRWVLSRGAVVERDEAGEPLVASGILFDISERRELTDALTAARDAADQANRAKSDFLASMSHEIRTPMNGVIGFADLLLDGKLDQEQQRNATLLKEAGKSLLAIINDILDVSKIEAGKLDLEHIPICLSEIADGTVSILRAQAIAKGIDLHLDIDRNLPSWVKGDPTRLRQILLNLMNNAIKFTERGSVTVRALREVGPAGAMARFEVSDTGIGVPSDKLDRLFQTFSQVNRSTSRHYGGTGLGLVISKRLAEAMGGEIGVTSEFGSGSTFWFTITAEACPAPDRSRTEARQHPTAAARILVAEDLYMNQVIIDSLLRADGHEVVLVANGAEAVEAVQTSDFDLVLMDMQMPVMDGIQATRMIRGLNERVRSIPIIALTANAMTDDISACTAAGMNGHLAKPIDREALSRIVAEWTGRGTRSPGTEMPASLATVNAPVLHELEDRLGKDKVALFVKMFREQLVKTMAAIAAAEDAQTLVREAHVLISMSGNLGFTELMTRSRELMDAAKRGAPDLSGLVAVLEAAAHRAQSAMNTRYPTS
ncbi:MAG TPA: PAS domain-containing protein [Stellaceae bacterium]|nr:PAS domain-containing protein [Stellaceae bacterium]